MKLLQITGPFGQGEKIIDIPAETDYSYIHIGIQIPQRSPMSDWAQETNPAKGKYPRPDIEINGIKYVVNQNNILEFDGLAELTWRISALKDLPAETIIDIAYRVEEN